MIDNPTLRAIRDRRSIRNFATAPVTDADLETILDAARWAPSGRNTQPWDFVVVRDRASRAALGAALRQVTFSWGGMAGAPVMIVVAVDPSKDPAHFVEDGAVAAQNLCLAAQSLGLGSSWAGVYAARTGRRTAESTIARLVGLPAKHRVIAVVPIGLAGRDQPATRRPLAEMVHHERYSPELVSSASTSHAEGMHDDGIRRELGIRDSRRSVIQPGKFS